MLEVMWKVAGSRDVSRRGIGMGRGEPRGRQSMDQPSSIAQWEYEATATGAVAAG